MYNVPARIDAGYSGEPKPPHHDDVIRRGDHVRALEGRHPGMGQTGIVEELKSRGRAVVFWTSEDRTTVPLDTLGKIRQGGA